MATSILQIMTPRQWSIFTIFWKRKKTYFSISKRTSLPRSSFEFVSHRIYFCISFLLIISTIVDDKIKVIFVEYYQYLSEFPYWLISDC